LLAGGGTVRAGKKGAGNIFFSIQVDHMAFHAINAYTLLLNLTQAKPEVLVRIHGKTMFLLSASKGLTQAIPAVSK